MRHYLILLFLIIFLVVPFLADATSHITYQPLVGIPGAEKTTSLTQFLQALFNLSLAIGAILAVLMLVIGGFQWMASEAAGQKEAGRERVKNAILGLLILLAAILILRTINPNLVNLNIVANAPGVNAPVAKLSGSGSAALDAPSIRELDPGALCSRGEYSRTTGGIVISGACRLKLETECARTGQALWTVYGYWCNRADGRAVVPIPPDVRDKLNPRIPTPDKPYVAQICKGAEVSCSVCIRHGGDVCRSVTLTPEYYPNEQECRTRVARDSNSNWESNCRAYPLP